MTANLSRHDPAGAELARLLRLERPLVLLDVETTGTAIEVDRVVELALVKLHPDGICTQWCQRFNPGMPIPPEVTAVHGIADGDVAKAPTFEALAREVWHRLDGCDLAGHNIRSFDLRILAAEMRRAGVRWSLEGVRVIDTKVIFYHLAPRDLNAAVARFVGPIAADAHAAVAHSALGDVLATMDVLAGQLAGHEEVPRSVAELHSFCVDRRPDSVTEDGFLCWRYREASFARGKHAGKSLREVAKVDRRYLAWMVTGDFSDEVKEVITGALLGRFPQPPALPEMPKEVHL